MGAVEKIEAQCYFKFKVKAGGTAKAFNCKSFTRFLNLAKSIKFFCAAAISQSNLLGSM